MRLHPGLVSVSAWRCYIAVVVDGWVSRWMEECMVGYHWCGIEGCAILIKLLTRHHGDDSILYSLTCSLACYHVRSTTADGGRLGEGLV